VAIGRRSSDTRCLGHRSVLTACHSPAALPPQSAVVGFARRVVIGGVRVRIRYNIGYRFGIRLRALSTLMPAAAAACFCL